VIQCVEKKLLVPGKDVRQAIVPAMAVAKESDPGRIIKGDTLGRLVHLGQSSVGPCAPTVLNGLWDWEGERLWGECFCEYLIDCCGHLVWNSSFI
jgi:hypothetical protein